MSRRPEDTPIHLGDDGVYWARPTVGRRRRPDGTTEYRRKLMRFPGARSERAARRMLADELALYGAAVPSRTGPLLPDVLRRYVAVRAAAGLLADSSARAYLSLVDNHVERVLGDLEAREVRGYRASLEIGWAHLAHNENPALEKFLDFIDDQHL